jgi:spore germination protein (amino acid permease)
MSRDKNKITAKQLATLIIASQIGVGILTLPPSLAKEIGHDGWLSVLFSGIATIPVLIVIIIFAGRYKDKTLVRINCLLYGKYLGSFFNFIFIVYLIFVSALILRIFVEVTKITVLRLTPAEVLTFVLFIPSMYLARYGFKAIARFANEVYVIVPAVLIFFLMVASKLRVTFLMPVGEAGVAPIAKSMLIVIPMFLGIELLPVIYSNLEDTAKVTRYLIAGHIYSTLFFTIVVAVTTLVYGEVLLKQLALPLFQVFRIFRSQLFERVDLFFNAIWFPAMGTTSLVYYYSGFYSLKQIFRVKRESIPFIIYTAVVLMASRIPKDFAQTSKILGLVGYWGMGIFAFFMISCAFSFVNKRGVVEK